MKRKRLYWCYKLFKFKYTSSNLACIGCKACNFKVDFSKFTFFDLPVFYMPPSMYGIHKLQILHILHGIELFWLLLTSRWWTICKYKKHLVSLVVVQVAIYHSLWCTEWSIWSYRAHKCSVCKGKTSFRCLTCPYIIGQCLMPYSVCGRGSSTCSISCIIGWSNLGVD